MDISDFAESFFEEASELLDEMESYLLELDPQAPDAEELNAIFRAAHSIKGGAGAFGFAVLQETTHIMENLLDDARKGELALNSDIIDTFLQTKDVLNDQLSAYRQDEEPDASQFEAIKSSLQAIAGGEHSGRKGVQSDPLAPEDDRLKDLPLDAERHARDPLGSICQVIQYLAQKGLLQEGAELADLPAVATGKQSGKAQSAEPEHAGDNAAHQPLQVSLLNVSESDRKLLLEELKHFGEVLESGGDDKRYEVLLSSSSDIEGIEAVMCFIVEADQLEIKVVTAESKSEVASIAAKTAPAVAAKRGRSGAKKSAEGGESASIRVPVEKVDQIINLVGELIITQSMLNQSVQLMEEGQSRSLEHGLQLLQRNARDLQEAVMSVRMVPMDYVFSRFPRVVRDTAAKLGKEIELITEGGSTELDKGLIERIIDPLTHLIRNSMDHGIEMPDVRLAAGKTTSGALSISARQQGGNIIIEVADDGAGLNRDKLLAKARSNGLDAPDSMTDEEVWQLIFAPGFSTAETVSDISGRGVGMDVVRRNIQSMGGHVEIASEFGRGTTTRIVLPLTLAIMDGMLLRVGSEIFVIPLGAVHELVQATQADIYTMAGNDKLLKVREDYLPIISLSEVMEVPGKRLSLEQSISVVLEADGRQFVLVVDEPIGQQQVVVKNLESNYRKVPGISAATILGDGRVALILDAVALLRCHHERNKKIAKKGKQRRELGEEEIS